MSLVLFAIRSKMKSQFNFTELNKCTFVLNYIDNEFKIIATGIAKGNIDYSERTYTQKGLNENTDLSDMLVSKIKTAIIFDKINLIYLKMDFTNRKSEAEVFFINNYRKEKRTIKLDF